MSAILTETIEHRDGVEWFNAPKPWRVHRHRWQTRAWTADGQQIVRCACGAFHEDGDWFHLPPDRPRVRRFP